MFEMLIALVLNNSSKDTIADRSIELLSLPFTKEEEEWFEDYLLRGDGRKIRNAHDTVMMRRVGTGSFKESLELQHKGGRGMEGLDWQKLSEGVKHGLGSRA